MLYISSRMPRVCFYKYCYNSSDTNVKDISFHSFPQRNDEKEIWINFMNTPGRVPSSSSVLCSDHFDEKNIIVKESGRKILMKGCYPTIFKNSSGHFRKCELNVQLLEEQPKLNEQIVEEHSYFIQKSPKQLKLELDDFKLKFRKKLRTAQQSIMRLKKRVISLEKLRFRKR